MATNNAVNNTPSVPVSIANGGTNAASMSTSTGIVKYDGSALVTSSTAEIDSSNRYTNSSQPCFLATIGDVSNVTGDSTFYTVVFSGTLFDQNSNFASHTFTAPVTGKYLFTATVTGTSISTTSFTQQRLIFVTTGLTYTDNYANPGKMFDSSNQLTEQSSVILAMTAADTATVQYLVAGSTKSVGILGASTFFSGTLIC